MQNNYGNLNPLQYRILKYVFFGSDNWMERNKKKLYLTRLKNI